MAFLIFYITYPDESTARHISNQLVQERWAACANSFPIQSAYWWDGKVQHDAEWVSVVKTSLALEKLLETEIIRLHPYDTPCIMRFEARANAAYEKWIEENVRPAPDIPG